MNAPLHVGHLPNGLCYWCRRQMTTQSRSQRRAHRTDLTATKDHIEPRSKGGSTTIWACHACNSQKCDLTLDEWRAFMAANPEWWVSFDTPAKRGKAYAAFRLVLAVEPEERNA